MEEFIDGMTRSWWVTAAVFIWIGIVWFPLLARLETWLERRRGICSQCDRLRAIHLDTTQLYLEFSDQIGVTPDEVARRELPIHALWTKTLLELEQHQRTHHPL